MTMTAIAVSAIILTNADKALGLVKHRAKGIIVNLISRQAQNKPARSQMTVHMH